MVVFTFGFLWVVSQWVRVRVSKTPLVLIIHSKKPIEFTKIEILF